LDELEGQLGSEPPRASHDRLDSWKKIAVYLKRDVSTVQRWERREGMPVHRHLHAKQGSVFAYRSELDAWWQGRRTQLAEVPAAARRSPAESAADRYEPAAAPKPARLSVNVGLLLVLAALIIACGLGWSLISSRTAWRNPLDNAKFSRLSDSANTAQAAAISPNGRYAAFLQSRDGQVDAWVGEIGGHAYRNVTQGALPSLVNPSIRTLGFSADSSLVTVWSRKNDGTHPGDVAIYAAPTSGGALRPYLSDAAEYAWSRDGAKLVYHTTAPGDPLFVRAREDAEAHLIYAALAGVHCHYPTWSPDASYIYFVRGVPPDDWDIWRIRASGQGLQRLTHHNARLAYPVMLDSRTLVYLMTDADGSGPWMYGLDPERPVPHRLTSGLETYTSLAGSAGGARLLATTANPRNSLWRLTLADGKATAEVPALLVENALTPRFAAATLVYVSSRNGGQGVWTLSHGTTREIWHSKGTRIVGAPAISPDSRRVAFTIDDGAQTRLLAVDLDGSHPTIVADSLQLRGNPAWSPDGHSIISAVANQGEPRLTRIFFDGRKPAALMDTYSVDPIVSADGRFLLYSGKDIGTTFPVQAAAADGRPYKIPSLLLTRGARRLVLSTNPPALIVLRGDMGHKDLWRIDLSDGSERQLTALPPQFKVGDFDISPDGAELVLDKVEDSSDLALIERSVQNP
jgi:Tol biopolymer transport system component